MNNDFLRRIFLIKPLNNDAGIFGVKLHRAADAVGLFAGDERGATTAKQVHHYAVGRRAVLDGIGQQRDGLHRRVLGGLLRLVEVPDSGLLAVCLLYTSLGRAASAF